MNSPKRPKPEITWDIIERVADQAKLARLQALTDEQLAQELLEAGIDPEQTDRWLQEILARFPNTEEPEQAPVPAGSEPEAGTVPPAAQPPRPRR